MRPDLLIASASAGLLVYSGRLLAPTARLRPETIIASLPALREPGVLGPEDVSWWPVFREGEIVSRIWEVLDGKVGFDLLVYGTIGSVLTVIAGAIGPSWNVPLGVEITSPFAALALGYGAGWWRVERSGWYRNRQRWWLAHCFLAWLEQEVGDPTTKGYELSLVIVNTARTSGCSLMGDLAAPMGAVLTDDEVKAVSRHIVALARKHRYRWRDDEIRKWANSLA